MLAIQLKNILKEIPDAANILVYIAKDGNKRQLLMSDIDIDHDKNLIIDTDYIVPVKITHINQDLR